MMDTYSSLNGNSLVCFLCRAHALMNRVTSLCGVKPFKLGVRFFFPKMLLFSTWKQSRNDVKKYVGG